MNERAAEREALLEEARLKEAEAALKLEEINQRLAAIDSEIDNRLQEAYQKSSGTK